MSTSSTRRRTEAINVLRSGEAEIELDLVASMTLPLFWSWQEDDRTYTMHHGSAFLMDCGGKPIVLTAAHVFREFRHDRQKRRTICQLHEMRFDLEERLIDQSAELDIATFWILPHEVSALKRTPFKGSQRCWPPDPPKLGSGVLYAGFPGIERTIVGSNQVNFRYLRGIGIATSVNERNISVQIEREHLIEVPGLEPTIPKQYDFRGISGGPLLVAIEQQGIRHWQLAGVIYEGHNANSNFDVDLIVARRIRFLRADGVLDMSMWQQT